MVKRYKRHNMKGGTISQQHIRQLKAEGFSDRQIESLQDLGVSFNEIMQKVNIIMNEGNTDPDYMTEQVMVELLNEHIFDNSINQLSPIPHADYDIHDIDISGTLDQSFSSQGTMNLNELNRSNSSGYTTSEDRSFDEFGGRRRRITTKKRRGKKAKKTRKQRGGMCFGKGVGANSFDPNNSIYNTNMLNLFPYKP